ncbi:unnamed protein product [Leptidea sinapis]|uniref:Uncharacterized protein n=1 Tax=Leptidea sinapis TaxID=189913 RepID=A0A5E4QGC3_9NEOP|nr:unnamed protein product [Leptidea sinapis]
MLLLECAYTVFFENDPLRAEIVKVVPTSNNGFPEVVRLHHTKSTKADDSNPDVWFIFQKSKYIYDWDKKIFHTIAFPITKVYDEYLESKGYTDDESILMAEKDFGKNEMIMREQQLHFLYFKYFVWHSGV